MSAAWTIKSTSLRVYRIGILFLICWMVREHHVRLKIQGDRPITLTEVREFLPKAERLKIDHSPKSGLYVLDAAGRRIGYTARVAPKANKIVGYSGPTDTLMVFGAEEKLAGIKIRHSYDTPSHVKDVAEDIYYMETWNGKTWAEIGAMQDLEEAGIYGVSGATRTSIALAKGLVFRTSNVEVKSLASPIHLEAGLFLVLFLALYLFFGPKKHRPNLIRSYYIFAFVYVGLVNGDLLAQSLFMGWMESGVPWRHSPGLVLLVAAAFLVPWSTGKSLYCYRICPHGIAQRWLGRLVPKKFHLKIQPDWRWAFRGIPGLLIVVVLLGSMFELPLDPANIEPFDAYIIRSAGIATIGIAIVGLIASLFVPMAYCQYGCPTGAALDFTRSRGRSDRFGRRDAIALALTILVFILWRFHEPIYRSIVS